MKKIFCFLLLFFVPILGLDLDFNTYSSNFTQIVKSENASFSYSGHFKLNQDQAYWNYEFPNKKEIYINKNEIVLVEHDLEQVIFSYLENIPNLNEIFKKAQYINPKQLMAKYENTQYIINLNDREVQSISYEDAFKNDILIILDQQVKNAYINPESFIPKFPPNYDIVH